MALPCSLPDTQSQREVDWSQQNIDVPKVWGWLYPARLYLKSLDISKSTVVLGRSANCDVIFNGHNLNPNILRIVSKQHFKIFRDDADGSIIIYLEDLSYNGTFVNGDKVGRGNKIILQNEDEIAIGHPSVKIYVFRCIYENADLPREINSKYIVSKLLGTGACGEVKLVWNKHTCQKFAMKKIIKSKLTTVTNKPKVNDPKRIMNEVKILKALDHPFVIHMEDIVDTDDAVYIILELMEGGELFDRIVENDRVPEDEAKLIFFQIASAVKYLHEQGITHRDLKPENILLSSLDPQTLVKVSDFGLSKFVAEESVLKTVCGTPMYVAPEILLTKGHGTYTKQIDVWSLGVILYVLLSGHLPFTQDDPNFGLQEQIIQGRYSFPQSCFEGVSDDAISLIKKMLVVDPEKRFTTKEILLHSWLDDPVMMDKIDRLLDSSKTIVEESTDEECAQPDIKKRKLQ